MGGGKTLRVLFLSSFPQLVCKKPELEKRSDAATMSGNFENNFNKSFHNGIYSVCIIHALSTTVALRFESGEFILNSGNIRIKDYCRIWQLFAYLLEQLVATHNRWVTVSKTSKVFLLHVSKLQT